MRNGWKNRRFSILGKLIVTFLIVISPMYVVGTRINDWGSTLVRQEIFKSLQFQLLFYRTSLENEIDRLLRLQREYVNDEDLESLSITSESLTDFQKLVAIKRFQARLNVMKQSSLYIARASAYIPPIGRTISTDELSGNLLPEKLLQLKKDATVPHRGLFYQDGEKVLLREYYPTTQVVEGRDPMFVLELELSIPKIKQYLSQTSDSKLGGAAVIHPDWAIVSTSNQEAYESISGPLREQSLQLEKAGTTNAPAEMKTVSIDKQPYLTVSAYSPMLGVTLLAFVPEKAVMGALDRYRLYMWLITLVAIVVVVLFSFYMYRIIHRPLQKLIRAFRKVESGDLQVSLAYKSSDEFHDLYEQFNYMVSHLNKLVFEVYEHKIHVQQSELKQLQSQINPHFLYNSFYLLYRMTKAHDFDNSTRFTKYLGDYFQYVTRNGEDEVPLELELQHVRALCEIQTIRFAGHITFSIEELQQSYNKVKVPRLILQPLVENAYQHGFEQGHENRHMSIHFTTVTHDNGSKLLLIGVEDNGKGMTKDELERWHGWLNGKDQSTEITGVLNVHRRLRLKYGELAGVRIESRPSGGLRVEIVLPLPESAESEMGE
ncbi:histidine kinase [Paenibacillus qinlingensis]|uniref:Two-component system sensor histidine kinase YesM n=1 Tax=Paenibacillus qinlingensis TaxID=1837343 RepID=A0ABU1NWJ1_9BACL|nr:histidine kinase [Paenibacillus qinlingensis]MDR6551850.1 two-component system sensor histidine kinase YesM [Paenibacillus qinlingensis]